MDKFNSLVLISPDWEYYKSISKLKGVNCAEPIPTIKIYKIIRDEQNQISIDSTTNSGKYPIINYRKSEKKPKIKTLIYHTDNWGSRCCPKDPKWLRVQEIYAFRKREFEKYKIKKTKSYSRNLGKEGEHAYYFTLDSLEPLERLIFKAIMIKSAIFDENLEKKSVMPELFFPYYIGNNNLKELN